ncbi:ABC transporter permease [Streptomyces sp. 549]|uniref:ABC transporter permease n=1 Tax=Streptomyces sp. 549 TaxID=3049076 RepID=UPI0024C29EAA|nr:ABC transporter permease [Streptomyces sp. 549]MDK1471976.1 ABC transporter permease [Streptomyces sp. 549]
MSEFALPRPAFHALTLTGRSLRFGTRNAEAVLVSLVLPVLLMLVFVYFFGGAIETGTAYVSYVVPGVLVLCAGYGASQAAVSVSADLTSGAVDRFRSLDVSGFSLLFGHVTAGAVRNVVATAAVFAVAFAIGFRPQAGPAAWMAALALLLAYVLAMSWLAACVGLVARSPEGAGAFTFTVLFLPYPSSAFVPVDTMPGWLHGFAEHQPVTPLIESLRGLLLAEPVGGTPWVALAWCSGAALISIAAAGPLFQRRFR